MLPAPIESPGFKTTAPIRAEQAIVSLLTTLIVYRLGVIVYSRRIAIWAAGIVCFYPAFLAYSNVLLSETWFILFAIGFIWLTIEAVHREKLSILVAASIALGLAALTRSIMLLFVPFLVLYLLWAWRGGWGKCMIAAIVPPIVFAIAIAPWAIRNTQVQQTLTLIDVMGGRNAMMGNYEFTPTERSWATISDVAAENAWHRVLARETGAVASGTQGQLDKRALAHAIRYVLANPGVTVKRDIVKFFNFWQLERTFLAAARNDYFRDLPQVIATCAAALACGIGAAILLAAIFGICCNPPGNLQDHIFLLGCILFPCAVHSLIFAHERYRLPVMPLLGLYAAAAFVNWRDIWSQRSTLGFRAAAGLCLLLMAGWAREFVMVDLNLTEKLFG